MKTKKHKFGKRLAAIITVMCMIFTMLPINALAFNPDWYKTHIKSVSIGKPTTDLNGRKYLPVTVFFTAEEDISDRNAVYFLEGYLKAKLKDGRKAEGIEGNGMTLIGPLKPDALDGMGSNAYSWNWKGWEEGGEGVLKYNIPLLEDSDTQTVEQSPYTGQQEVNGLKVGDEVSFEIETVMNTEKIPAAILPPGGSLMSDEFPVVIEDSSQYPKDITTSGSSCEHDGDVKYVSNGQTTHKIICAKCNTVLEEYAPHYMSVMKHDKDYHWTPCTYCKEQLDKEKHDWEWLKDENGAYTGQKCKVCGQLNDDMLGYINLDDMLPAFPAGMDENSLYTQDKAKDIGLKDDKGTAVDKDSYTVSVETSKSDDTKWTVDFKSVEDKSIGKKTVEVLKACEHDGKKLYDSQGDKKHNIICKECEKVIGEEEHVFIRKTDTFYFENSETHKIEPKYGEADVCTKCGEYTNFVAAKDLSKATPAVEEGKAYKQDEAKNIPLKDEKGETVDKNSYTVTVETSKTDENKWTVTYDPVEGKSTGKKEITVIKGEETYSVTVNYTVVGGLAKPKGFVAQQTKEGLKNGESYSISSPVYPGYSAVPAKVEGKVAGADVVKTVEYIACEHIKYTVTGFIKPTCTEDSDVVMATCDKCGKEIALTAAQIHALGAPYVATGHNFDEEWHKEYGIKSKPGNGHYHRCLNRGCTARQYEPHVWSGEQKSGTKCGKDFVIEDECAICGAKYEYTPEECKLVRTPEKDVAPTCEEYGFEKYVCSVCGIEASDAIAPLGHDMEVVEEEKADCEKEGYKLRKCKREGCDHEEKEILEKTSKTGKHTWVQNVGTEPTCEGFGTYDGKVCTVCGKVEKAEGDFGTIEKLGHSVITTKKNLGTKPGVTKSSVPVDITVYEVIYSCTRCKSHLGTEIWTVVTASRPPRYQIIPGRKAEITDMCNGIHVSGNMAQDGGVYFRDQVMKGFDDVIDSEEAKSKYQYKKIKANSFIIEFADSFLADLEDGVYPIEIVNGKEFWPLIVTVEDHKLVDLADQEYPKETDLTNDEYAELIESYENDGIEVKELFAVPLTEEDLTDIQDLPEEEPEQPTDEPSDEPTDEPEQPADEPTEPEEEEPAEEPEEDTEEGPEEDTKDDKSGSKTTDNGTGSTTGNPQTGAAATAALSAITLAGAVILSKKRR